MSLPALADLADLAARLPGGIGNDDEPRAQAALDDASALIRAETGETWVTDDDPPTLDAVPGVAVTICVAAAKRAFVNPDGVAQESLDGYSTSYRNDSSDVYLTRAERRLLGKLSAVGLGVQRLTRADEHGALDTRNVGVGVSATSTEFPYDL